MSTLRHLALVVFGALAIVASAQEPLRPAVKQEAWLAAAVQGRLPKFLKGALGKSYSDIRFRSELGYRSADVFYAGKQNYLDVNLKYKLGKVLSVAYEHRFSVRPNVAGLQNRSIFQAELEKKFEHLSLGYRFIWQHSYIEWTGQREVLRNKFQLDYNIKGWKLDPQFSVEFFTWAGYKGMSYFGTRYQFGTEIPLNKANSVTVALVHDRERDVAWPTQRWIASLTYSLNIRELKL